MFRRLLMYIVVGLLFLTACAKPPVMKLEETRRIVAHAYASGASHLAAKEYQLANDSLQVAEELVQKGRYQEAEAALGAARNYSNKALARTVKQKQQVALEEKKLAEEKRLAEKRAREKLLLKEQEQERARKAAVKIKVVAPPIEVVAEEPQLVDRVEVAPAENLMMIAARPEVYNDGWLWPLIYKANRDQIKDPKEIFTGQELLIPRDKSPEEVEAARLEAEELNLF